jgi:hypothetical protein
MGRADRYWEKRAKEEKTQRLLDSENSRFEAKARDVEKRENANKIDMDFETTHPAAISIKGNNTPFQETFKKGIDRLAQQEKDREILKKMDDEGLSTTLAGLSSLNKGLTWNAYSPTMSQETRDAQRVAQEAHPTVSTLSELLGFAGSPFTKVAGAAAGALGTIFGKGVSQVAPKLMPIVENPVVKNAARAGVEMGGFGGVSKTADLYREGGVSNVINNTGQIAKEAVKQGAFGAILGGGMSLVGAEAKGLYRNATRYSQSVENIPNMVDNYQFPQIREPQIVPRPELKSTINSEIPLKYQQRTPSTEPLMLKESTTPPKVPTEFKTEIAGSPNSNFKLPGNTSMLTRPAKPQAVESNLRPSKIESSTNSPLASKESSLPPLNAKETEVLNNQAPKPKYSPEIQSKVDTLEAEYKQRVDSQKKYPYSDPTTQSKKLKGMGMEHSAQKRAIIQGDSLIKVEGGLNENELAKKITDLKSNYKGKDVITPDGEGKIRSTVFGKVQVRFENGEVRSYTKEQIQPKTNIDEIIAKQKEAVTKNVSNINADNSLKTESPKVENIKTEVPKTEPIKTEIPKAESKPIEPQKPPEPPKPTETKKEPEKKVSKFGTNTIRRTTEISPETKVATPESTFGYETTTTPELQAKARKNVMEDFDGTARKLIEKEVHTDLEIHEAAIIAKHLEKEALKTGDMTRYLEFMEKGATKGSSMAGKSLKSVDTAWEKEPLASKAIMEVQKIIKKAEESFSENSPKKYAEFKEGLKVYKDSVKATAEFVANDLKYHVENGMKILDINLQLFAKGKDRMAEYIKKYYTSDPLERMNVVNKLVKEFGLNNGEAKSFESYLKKSFDKHFEKQSEKYLNSLMNAKGKQNPTLEKVLKLIKSGAYEGIPDNAQISSILKKKYGMPSLTTNEAKTIIHKMNALQKMNPKSDGYRVTLGEVQKIIADKQPSTFREKFRGIQRVSFLLNPKTLFTRNPGGNIVIGGVENIKDIPASWVDMVVSKIRGSERTTLGNPVVLAQKLGWQAQGMRKGFRDWIIDIKHGTDTSPSRGMLELPSGRTFDSKSLNALDQVVRKSLQLGDRPFYEAAYKSRINELMKIKKITEVTPEIEVEARLYALDRVFQNNSALSKRASKLRDSLGLVGDIVMPFTQTPANVLDKLIDYSPGGMIKGLTQIGESAIKGTEFNQKLFVDRLGRSFTGAGILALGYALASLNVIEGGPDKSKDANNFNKSIGNTPYSIKLGNKTITFNWMQPIGGLIAMGADAYRAGKNKADFLGKITAGGSAGINTMIDQSFLQGVMDLLSGYSPAASIGNTLFNSSSGLASPTGVKQIAKIIDPIERETYAPGSKEYINKIIKGIPFASRLLPAKKDTFGNVIQKESNDSISGVAKNIFNTMFNPGNMSDYKPTDVQKEIMRVYDKTGKTGIFPNTAEKSIKVNGENYPLTPEQYGKYQTIMGKYVEDTMKQVVSKNSYKNTKITDEQRAKALTQITTDSKQYAEDILAKDMGLKEKKVKKKKNPIKVPDNSKKKY